MLSACEGLNLSLSLKLLSIWKKRDFMLFFISLWASGGFCGMGEPVGIVEWGGVIIVSLGMCLRIKPLNNCIAYLSSIRSVSCLNYRWNIYIDSKTYQRESHFKHYASLQFLPCVFTQVRVDRTKRSINQAIFIFEKNACSSREIYLIFELHIALDSCRKSI